ncbi:hypothetical protein F0562_019739 [Nyssa sinensis]|uniref:CCHC-type domain-containing protein n=1 Tax=Nyssa sinensis TaxID=561372 RepID=A0A5J5BQA6_9ASTE|nr:hypothetical protein F0562_019739 [Nyssa sinensis]
MELPRFVVLKSIYNRKYLHYVKEDVQMHGFLQFSGDEVVSPYAKYEVEMAKSGRGLVNIRCCYNNKYWVRWSQKDNWIVAEADEPQEDISKWSCTLFDPIYVDAMEDRRCVRFRHVQLDHYTCLWRTGGVYDSCLFAGSNAPDGDQCDVCAITDWESLLILPKHVAFKGDNGKYLSTRMIHRYRYLQFASNDIGYRYLQFASDDIGDPTVGNEVFTTRDGSVRIKSNHFGKFWRASPSWILADSDDTSSNNSDTLFWPIKVDNRVVALRNLGNNNFCKRLSTEGKKNCLNAAISTISKEARLEVVELVLSRAIYNVNYRLRDARIYSQSVLTMANGTAINRSKEPSTVEVKLQYTQSRSKTWNTSVSLKLGIKTSIQTGVPLIAEGKIEIEGEFTGEYQWGQTDESSTGIETVYTVTVPPMTMVKVSLLATKGSCDVPFSYSQRDTLTNGDQITSTMDDGVYTGINCFNFKYENKPFKLEYPDESLISISGNPTTESSNAVEQSLIGAYLKPISVGPFGGHGGQEWDDGIYTTIRQLIITSGLLVDSIQIEYDENGSSKWSEKHGKSEGATKSVVKLDDPGEFLVSISGHYGKVSELLVIRSLKIESNKRTYGPFGVEEGEYFKFPSTSSKIRGFHGRSGLWLDSIGAYFKPIFVGPFGGLGGQEWDDGIYTTIRQLIITYGLLVDSIQIEFDENGSSKWSEKHGESEGGTKSVVKLDYPGEFLVSISGHYGKAPGEFLVSAISSASNITASINSIPMLNGTNFKTWHENLQIVLGVMDLDLALRVSSPAPLTDESSSDEKRDFERWEKSNRMCLMIIKKAIPEAFRGTISETIKTAKEFLEEIKNRFAKNEKSETSTLLANLISMRYKGNGNIREYIMEMSHLASKLRAHKLDLSEDLLVHLVLISLPTQFSQFKVSYNCQKETWSLNELISHCVQEEERLKQEKIKSAHLASTSKDKGKKRKKNKEAAEVPYQKKQHKEKNVDGCFFCGAVGHKKKQCTNYHAWRAKKGDGKKFEVEAIGIFRGYKFYDPNTRSIFETENARFFEDVEFDRGDKGRDFVFEEEYVDIPTTVIDIDQAPIPDIVQEADPNQNNIQEPPVPEEQTLPPLEPMPLRRSTRERRSAVPDDYIVFLQEHEFDIVKYSVFIHSDFLWFDLTKV